jgi:hypothetical protein
MCTAHVSALERGRFVLFSSNQFAQGTTLGKPGLSSPLMGSLSVICVVCDNRYQHCQQWEALQRLGVMCQILKSFQAPPHAHRRVN